MRVPPASVWLLAATTAGPPAGLVGWAVVSGEREGLWSGAISLSVPAVVVGLVLAGRRPGPELVDLFAVLVGLIFGTGSMMAVIAGQYRLAAGGLVPLGWGR